MALYTTSPICVAESLHNVRAQSSFPTHMHVSQEHWEDAFRQYWHTYRQPSERAPLGTQDIPVSWNALDTYEKVRVHLGPHGLQLTCLHELCEWQLAWPERLRRMNDSDDDAVTWVREMAMPSTIGPYISNL